MWASPLLVDYVNDIHKNLQKIGANVTKEDITEIISSNKIVFIIIKENHRGRPSKKENRIQDIFAIPDVKI